ncbi:hypothetical protein C2G38_2042472 [Gigaspora rosea]|uniref:Uncharacterized protein n=1 Tax=Gigaspora rosea TaxID=44941 RepID=A0A397UQR4_9GLOM|nr:hypothetical protein C2G38_2042472 [Gigaspora rosea]
MSAVFLLIKEQDKVDKGVNERVSERVDKGMSERVGMAEKVDKGISERWMKVQKSKQKDNQKEVRKRKNERTNESVNEKVDIPEENASLSELPRETFYKNFPEKFVLLKSINHPIR